VARSKKVALRVTHKAWDKSKRFARTSWKLAAAFVHNPRIIHVWWGDIRAAVVHFGHWVATGFRLFGVDMRASFILTKRVALGYSLTIREKNLLVRTTSDCMKLVPFSLFIIVPFAELALPLFLRMFPNMLPSTFFEKKFDKATLARKFKAKQDMAEFWQQVVFQRTKEISETDDHKYANRAEELHEFQEKLIEATEFPSLKEILKFSRIFKDELGLKTMSSHQLLALSKLLGLPAANGWWPSLLEVQLRHHIVNLRREDRDYFWEGIDGLTQTELIDACRKRAIRFHDVSEEQMRSDLNRWLEISANHRQIPTSLLLWIQSFYLTAPEVAELQYEPEEKGVDDPSRTFAEMAERRKAKAEEAQHRLEDLRHEIAEVVDHCGEGPAAAAQGGEDQGHEDGGPPEAPELCEEQRQKRQMMQHMREQDDRLHLYRDIVERQKVVLDHQLAFLASMRDCNAIEQKEAKVVLAEQQARVVEMIDSFKKDTEDIEDALGRIGVDLEGPAQHRGADLPRPAEQPAPPDPRVGGAAAREPADWSDLDASPVLSTPTLWKHDQPRSSTCQAAA